MFGKKQPLLSAILLSALGENPSTLFARQLADENGLYYVGFENGSYKFHDVIFDKEIIMNEDDVLKEVFNN